MVYEETIRDAFDIMYSYYKSRMSRFLEVVKKMKKDPAAKGKNLKKWQKEFTKASRNRLETKYKIPKNNTFQLVLDESLPRNKAYMGLIPDNCY